MKTFFEWSDGNKTWGGAAEKREAEKEKSHKSIKNINSKKILKNQTEISGTRLKSWWASKN